MAQAEEDDSVVGYGKNSSEIFLIVRIEGRGSFDSVVGYGELSLWDSIVE
jgi:hypothetical protein